MKTEIIQVEKQGFTEPKDFYLRRFTWFKYLNSLWKSCNVEITTQQVRISPTKSRPDGKIPPAPGTNQIAGFVEFRLLMHWEKKKYFLLN